MRKDRAFFLPGGIELALKEEGCARRSLRDSTRMAEELAQRKLFIGGLSYATDDGE